MKTKILINGKQVRKLISLNIWEIWYLLQGIVLIIFAADCNRKEDIHGSFFQGS